MYKDQR